MKKILKFLGIISFIGINTTSLIACNKPQYTEKELADLKEKNNIITKDGILEGIAPQEKPFNKVDNKGYFVIGKGNKDDKGRIAKFKNNADTIIIDNNNYNRKLEKTNLGISKGKNLYITNQTGIIKYVTTGPKDNKDYFESVYRGNNDNEPDINIENKLKKI